ncbi:alpha-tubulin N-acetyltransferase 1 [Trichonephila clavipes]|nr:alpha-tubulin N-acetyltransferase 1 [Trichonephila clavipes]
MEFPFDLNDIIPGRITVLESKDSSSDILIYDLESKHDSSTKDTNGSWTYIQTSNAPWDIKIKKRKEQLELILDEMGIASAKGLLSLVNTGFTNPGNPSDPSLFSALFLAIQISLFFFYVQTTDLH